ncbi:MAG: transposase [Candidatus Kryptoniota bacterium]
MYATEIKIPSEVFSFCGQSKIDTFSIDVNSLLPELCNYDGIIVNRVRLCLEAIRKHSDSFSFWQHRRRTGRPPIDERTFLIAFLIRQLFKATFRDTEGILMLLAEYFEINQVPDHTNLSVKNKSRRWLVIWRRFHQYILSLLPKRKIVVATDATGFSARINSWRETDYGIRASQDWIKTHAAVEVDSFSILSYSLTKSNVHESQPFEEVWGNLPRNITPLRSLADSAYNGEKCLQVALRHGATPIHGIKKNARFFKHPETQYQKMTNFATHWPNRYAEMYGKRNHAETAFSMITRLFGYRLRCRSRIGRKNEVQAKLSIFNLFLLAKRDMNSLV